MKCPTALASLACAIAFLMGTAHSSSAADPDARKPDIWAIVVAIDAYNDAAIPACEGAIRDGAALARWFTDTAHWSRSHLLFLNENGVSRHGAPGDAVSVLTPTRSNLHWALTQWLAHRVRPGDHVVVSFAGHATVASGRTVLLPIDARSDDLWQTGWAPDDAIDALAKKGCTVTLWLDTSPFGRGSRVGRADPDAGIGVRFLNRLTRWPGVSAWLAADGQPAGQGSPHSAFASALLQSLGTRPTNVLACLDRMQQDPKLRKQGFRVRGGIGPELTLWPADLLPEHRFRPRLLLQQGHADAVTVVSPAADDEFILTGSLDSTVRLWKLRGRESTLLNLFAYHMVGVTALALSPDGRYVASGDGAGQVRVWDLVAQSERAREGPSPHRSRISQVAFLPGEQANQLVSLDQDGRSVVWEPVGAALRAKPLSSAEIIRMAAARRDGAAAAVLVEADGEASLLDGIGKPAGAPLEGTGARPAALDLAPDGNRLAIGDEDGRVRIWDLKSRKVVFKNNYEQGVTTLRFDSAGALAVGTGSRLFLAVPGETGAGCRLEGLDDEPAAISFSSDDRWLAALTASGELRLWDLADRAHPALRTLPLDGRSAGFTSLAFSRDGRTLIVGEGDGTVRTWDLAERLAVARIAHHRGKVSGLAVSHDGRFVLQMTQDHQTLVWDLKLGRGANPIPGGWIAGAFLPGGAELVMTRDAKREGDVVRVDRASGEIRATFQRPNARGSTQPSKVNFGRIAVSLDGEKIAAAAVPGQDELVCVWNREGGKPRTIRGHRGALTGLGFSRDARYLFTASEDGTAKVWDLAAGASGQEQPVAEFKQPREAAITAAQINPADPHRAVVCQRLEGQISRVSLWEWGQGKPASIRSLGEIQGQAHAVVFADDGRWVGVAGQDRAMHFWTIEPGKPAARVQFEPGDQHTEQVNTLALMPGARMFASGGDDTTVRLWNIDANKRRGMLLGTLVASTAVRADGPLLAEQPSPQSEGADWVAYTPDGVYDSSLNGDRLVSFAIDGALGPLEQFAPRFHKIQLTDDLRAGNRPAPLAHTAPPTLVIDTATAPDAADRDVTLKLEMPSSSLNAVGLRLYQNGVPVREGAEFESAGADNGTYSVRVRLRRGVNRFYAMAGRPGDIDARSAEIELRYDRETDRPRVHVLALGVKDYTRNALKYADSDAQRIAEHIHRHGIGETDELGEKIVLTDREVNLRSVDNAFAQLRRTVKDRPDDAVVVFLAGHTDVLKADSGRERFTLLLSRFPFPENAPLLAMNRGVGVGESAGPVLPSNVDLPFYVIYRQLSRLGALNRLVIIDACQAEAIYDDPGVHQIDQMLANDLESRQTKTSYLLAARRGELANESEALGHGLLTYVLLRGMQATDLRPVPGPPLDEPRSADADNDGVVTTQELSGYTNRVMRTLASRLPLPTSRGATRSARDPEPRDASHDRPQLRTSNAGFGLVTLPKPQPNR